MINLLKNIRKRNTYKLIFQLGILSLLVFMGIKILTDNTYVPDFEAYCPLGGAQALGSYIKSNTLACTMSATQIFMAVMLVIGLILAGKLFCGYICPLGTVSEYLSKIGRKIRISIQPKGLPDLLLRSLKYILLFITFYFTLESSELFCKKYDPYYALVSGFNADVVLPFAVAAIVIVIAGSIFLRLFWCKYLCPLSAFSNLFRFTWWTAGTIVFYYVLHLLDIPVPVIWLLAVICAGGYFLEIWKKENVPFTLTRITRNERSCINCGLCTKKCPQDIDVAAVSSVKHIDCNLCGDCLYSCPEKDTLQINRRNLKWLPAVLLVALITMGLALSDSVNIPTIDQKWGTEEALRDAATFSMEGLKNIKCYGSSMAFAARLKGIEGIFGVATYVKTHAVKILYDQERFDDLKLQELLFTPLKESIRDPFNKEGSIIQVSFGIENFFDPMDGFYLTRLLEKHTSACGFQTEFGCPVTVHAYFPSDSVISISDLKKILESERFEYTFNGQIFHVKLNYRINGRPEITDTLSFDQYSELMYIPLDVRFNDHDSFSEDVLKIYYLPLGENSEKRNDFPYLISHLSNHPGIIAFKTRLEDSGEQAIVVFVDSMITPESIFSEMNADSLHFTYNTGETGARKNPFEFSVPGNAMNIDELTKND